MREGSTSSDRTSLHPAAALGNDRNKQLLTEPRPLNTPSPPQTNWRIPRCRIRESAHNLLLWPYTTIRCVLIVLTSTTHIIDQLGAVVAVGTDWVLDLCCISAMDTKDRKEDSITAPPKTTYRTRLRHAAQLVVVCSNGERSKKGKEMDQVRNER